MEEIGEEGGGVLQPNRIPPLFLVTLLHHVGLPSHNSLGSLPSYVDVHVLLLTFFCEEWCCYWNGE